MTWQVEAALRAYNEVPTLRQKDILRSLDKDIDTHMREAERLTEVRDSLYAEWTKTA